MGRKKKNNALVGLEIELFTLDTAGKVASSADKILMNTLNDPYLKQECSTNMLEVVSSPNEMVPDSLSHLLSELDVILDAADKNNLLLLPLGCYPGSFEPTMRKNRKYAIQESIFGKEKFKIAGRCAGFHTHYTLPHGIFDEQLRMLKLIAHAKIKDNLVNSYNLAIAMDPCLTTFMQSSPYYQGVHIGKDSRMIMYRGGADLKSPDGMYADLHEFGGLPHYKQTTLDIMEAVSGRFEQWKSLLLSAGINLKVLALYQSVLSLNWSPVKVNPHGTLEQRGMDMNHLEYVAATSVLLKFMFKKFQEEHFIVKPSEIGIKEPFKLENNTIYIPPYNYVKSVLEPASAYEGLESSEIHMYCKRLVMLAENFTPRDKRILLRPLKKMVRERKTVSDMILKYVRKKGYSTTEPLPNHISKEIALDHAEKFRTSVDKMKRLVESRF